MLILDTNFLIAFLKGESAAEKKLETLDEQITTTSINAFELLYGYHLMKDSQVIDKALGLLSSMTVLLFDMEAAVLAANIAADLVKKGKMLEHMDILIASIALKYGATVLTKNVKHLSRIQKLTVESW